MRDGSRSGQVVSFRQCSNKPSAQRIKDVHRTVQCDERGRSFRLAKDEENLHNNTALSGEPKHLDGKKEKRDREIGDSGDLITVDAGT